MIGAGQKFGKYTLLERIAEGGMAEIYKASAIGNDGREHVVALKRLHRAFCEDQELTAMLVDEARIAVQLHHPHIAQVFDLGSIDMQHFLVMEFVAGHDLHQLLRFARQKRVYLPIPAIILTLIHVADALQYAHTRHDADGRALLIVHRDVSPQNIMISTRGEVKLVDFGIAKAKNRAQVTQHGIIKGKYYYMAPEQAHGHHVDGRTDIYALGMVLYEGLTGRSPFEEVPEVELLKHVRQSSFPPPSYYRPDLDPELDAIVERMTQRDPNLRYQSMAEVRAALADFGTRKLQPFGPVELARAAEELSEIRPTVEYDILQPNAFAPSESSMIFNVESGLLELHSSEFELVEEEANALFESNPFGGADPTVVYADDPPYQGYGAMADQSFHDDPNFSAGLAFDPRQQQQPSQPSPQPQYGHAQGQGGGQPQPNPYGQPQGPSAGYGGSPAGPSHAMAPAHSYSPDVEPTRAMDKPGAPDFNAGRPKKATPPPKSLAEKLSEPPAIYGLIGVAVILLGALAAIVMSQDGETEQAAAAEPPPSATTATAETTPPVDDSIVKFAVGSTPPNAKIFIDGEDQGTTPKLIEFERGSKHEVVIKRAGYATFTRTVEVGTDPDELLVELELASGILKIQSYPPGAIVSIGGREIGKTNLTESGLPLDQKLTVVAQLDDKKMEKEVVWNPAEEPIQELMFEFEQPPAVDEAVAVQEEAPAPVRRRAPRRTTQRKTTTTEKKSGGNLNVWGEAAKEEPAGGLDVWGGKKKKTETEEKKEPAGGLDVWGGS